MSLLIDLSLFPQVHGCALLICAFKCYFRKVYLHYTFWNCFYLLLLFWQFSSLRIESLWKVKRFWTAAGGMIIWLNVELPSSIEGPIEIKWHKFVVKPIGAVLQLSVEELNTSKQNRCLDWFSTVYWQGRYSVSSRG